jgi:hypothetical protein
MLSSARPLSHEGKWLLLRAVTLNAGRFSFQSLSRRFLVISTSNSPLRLRYRISRINAKDRHGLAILPTFTRARSPAMQSLSWYSIGGLIVGGIIVVIPVATGLAKWYLASPALAPCPIAPPNDDSFLRKIDELCTQSDGQKELMQKLKECEWRGRPRRHQKVEETLSAMRGFVRLASLKVSDNSAVQYNALCSLNKLLAADLSDCNPAPGLVDVEKHLYNLLITDPHPLLRREATGAYRRVMIRLLDCTPQQLGDGERAEIRKRAEALGQKALDPSHCKEPWVQCDLRLAFHTAQALTTPTPPVAFADVVAVGAAVVSIHHKAKNLAADNYQVLVNGDLKDWITAAPLLIGAVAELATVQLPTVGRIPQRWLQSRADDVEQARSGGLLAFRRFFDHVDLTSDDVVEKFIERLHQEFGSLHPPRGPLARVTNWWVTWPEHWLVDFGAAQLLVEVIQSPLVSSKVKERALDLVRDTYLKPEAPEMILSYLGEELPSVRSICQQLLKEAKSNPHLRHQEAQLQTIRRAQCENEKRLKELLRKSIAGNAMEIFDHYPVFVGRREFLVKLERTFNRHPVIQVRGVGGAGKTRLLLGYLAEHPQQYDRAYRLDGQNSTVLVAEVRALAKELQIPEGEKLQPEELCRKVREILEQSGRPFLLIIDNIQLPSRTSSEESPDSEQLSPAVSLGRQLRELIPKTGGHAALISQESLPDWVVPPLMPKIDLMPNLDEDSALQLFQAVIELLCERHPTRPIPDCLADQTRLRTVFKLLEYHPAAISGLASSVFNSPFTWEEIIREINRGLAFFRDNPQLTQSPDPNYDKFVHVSWDPVIKRVKENDEAGGKSLARLLRLCARMPADFINLEYVSVIQALMNPSELPSAEFDAQWNQEAARLLATPTTIEREQFCELADTYLLLQQEKDRYTIHRLLQDRLRFDLPPQLSKSIEKAVKAFSIHHLTAYANIIQGLSKRWDELGNRPENREALLKETGVLFADTTLQRPFRFVGQLLEQEGEDLVQLRQLTERLKAVDDKLRTLYAAAGKRDEVG